MRLPKYRAWDKTEQVMCPVRNINLDRGCFLIGNSPTPDFTVGDMFVVGLPEGHFVEFNDLELMTFTGLYDKDKVEVYEGDIVKVTNKGAYNGNRVVVWDDILLSYVLVWADEYAEWKDTQQGTTYLKVSSGIKCNVVGNIYQNRELLTNEKGG